MELNSVIKSLSPQEKKAYETQTASEYFRHLYYSQDFIKILDKMDTTELLSDKEWTYLLERLFLVTYKALSEEDTVSFMDRLTYMVNSIAIKVFKSGKLHTECEKMMKFINSVIYEREINEELVNGLEMVENSRSESELSILINQHREAAIFRDNQDAFIDSYKESNTGSMSNQDIVNMNCMDRAYFRVKELVKEY
jgi:hypothetical protein